MKATTPSQDLLRGIWRENPVLIQLLGNIVSDIVWALIDPRIRFGGN